MTVQRSILILLPLLSIFTAAANAGSGYDAELNFYLRGNPENAWVAIEPAHADEIKKPYQPGMMIIRNLKPGKVDVRFIKDNGSIHFVATLKANMRTIIECEWVDGKFNIISITRREPIEDSRFKVTNEMLTLLPFERKATAPLSTLPGILGSDVSNIHGATQRANRYLVDGVDVTDPFNGTLELELPFIALEQVAIRYDDPESEGSVISLATAPIYSFDGQFSADGSFFFETSDFPDEIEDLFYPREREMYDAEALFGWGSNDGGTRMLGAVRYQNDDFREQPERFRPIETRVPAALLRFEKKLGRMWKLNAGWYASFKENGSLFAPSTEVVDIRESDSELVTADEIQNVQLFNSSISYRSSRMAASAWFSYYRGNSSFEPSSANRLTPTLYDGIADPAILVEGSILPESRDDLRERLSFGAMVDRKQYFFGWHRLSMEVKAEFNDMHIERAFNGGYGYDYSETLGRAFRRYSYEQNGSNSILDQRSIGRYRFTLEDTWNLRRLTLDLGAAFDKTTGSNDVADVFDWSSVEPRFQASLDVLGDGQYILRGGYQRSYFRLLGVQIPGNPYARNIQFYDAITDSWETSPLNKVEQFGYRANGVDADIDRPYADIVNLGASFALGERSFLNGAWTWRREKDLIEDIETNLWPNYTTEKFENELGNNYNYFVTNPGLDETTNPFYFLTNVEDLEREYYGVDLAFTFKPDKDTYLWAAYTWSRTNGNIDNTLEESTGSSRVYNDPNERINTDGFLSSDMRHMLRLAFIWNSPLGIKVGSILRYDSGAPLNRLHLNPDVGRFEILADPRGSIYRADAATTVDLRLSRSINFSERMAGTVILDLFNLTDDETPTAYYVDDEKFGYPIERREPRRWRLGLQFRF